MNDDKKTGISSRAKKSIVAGGLIGTFGFFVAKAIGLLYSIPFSSILGSDALMSYYGSAYPSTTCLQGTEEPSSTTITSKS